MDNNKLIEKLEEMVKEETPSSIVTDLHFNERLFNIHYGLTMLYLKEQDLKKATPHLKQCKTQFLNLYRSANKEQKMEHYLKKLIKVLIGTGFASGFLKGEENFERYKDTMLLAFEGVEDTLGLVKGYGDSLKG